MRVTGAGSAARFEVIDTGPGIRPDVLARLFRPFERGSSRPGSGLGLATVRRLVESAGGAVEVHSRLGEGSTFIVTLPRVAESRYRRAA